MPVLRGFVINVAKRVETASRDGRHFRVLISGAAFKRVNRRIRSLLIGPKDLVRMRGIVMPVAVHEVIDSFIDPTARMAPESREAFAEVARGAMRCNSFDAWIHSCYQLIEARKHGQRVTDKNLEWCRDVLNLDPGNAVALYYAAGALVDLGPHAMAMVYLPDLTRRWPTFADGWLVLARTALKVDEPKVAAHAVRQARRHGAKDEEQPLCLT